MTPPREAVVFARAAVVERVPHGTRHELPAGTRAEITQALGASFTLYVEGQLVRLPGADADAIGKPVPVALTRVATNEGGDLQAQVWDTLRQCYDPEIPVNIVELGLVYDVRFTPEADDRSTVEVDMTLTAPGCGMGDAIADDVCERLLALPQVAQATVNMVFDPPWDRSRISEGAALLLGL
jgi:probable FeS assembly SUF system protein SufT